MVKLGNRGSAFLLILAVLAVFARTATYEFILYDDDQYVTGNPQVLEGFTSSSIAWALRTQHMGSWHPLTWFSHMADVEVFGTWAGGHHLVNVLLHAGSTGLLFWVLLRMTGLAGASFLVAALFGLHPLRVESVAWVAERKDVLSTFFWMLTLAAYAAYTGKPSRPRYLAVAACLGLGLLAKPMLVTLPFTLLLLDIWPLRRWGPGSGNPGGVRIWREKIPLFALAAGSALVTLQGQEQVGAMRFGGFIPLATRIQNAAITGVAYLEKTVLPTKLAVLYPHRAMTDTWSVGTLPAPEVAASVLLLVAVTVAVFLVRRRRPYFLVGWLWYLVTLVPVLGIVQVGGQSMADRYTYVPQVGILLAAVWGLRDACRALRIPVPARAGVAGAMLGGLILATSLQLGHWKDSIRVFGQAIRVTRVNPVAHYNLAVALKEKGRLDETLPHLRRAVAIAPSYAEAQHALVDALESTGRVAEAAVARSDHGAWLGNQGRTSEAETAFRDAVSIDPSCRPARMNLGYLLRATGRPAEAAAQFEEVLRLRPDDSEARAAVATVKPGAGS